MENIDFGVLFMLIFFTLFLLILALKLMLKNIDSKINQIKKNVPFFQTQ